MKKKIFCDKTYQTNSYLLLDNDRAIIIDPGYNAKEINDFLKKEELNLIAILFTHGHYDHIGESEILFKSFPDARVFLDSADYILLMSDKRGGSAKLGLNFTDINLAENDNIPFSGKTIGAGGHTLGSRIYLFPREGWMFSGDTLFKNDTGRVDLFNADSVLMKKTFKKILDIDRNYQVFPGHGPETTLDDEREMLRREAL